MTSKIVINAKQNSLNLNLKELYNYRELLFIFAYRDLRVKYAQTALGFLWSILQPLVTIFIFRFVFVKVAHIDTQGIPYPIFSMAALAAWGYFAYIAVNSGSSIIQSQNMIRKIYFPRLILPLSKVAVGFVDFGIALFFLLILMVWYGFFPTWHTLLYLPFYALLTMVAGLTAGIWISALTIRYRDFQHIIPFAVQIGLYLTPVAYPTTLISPQYLPFYYLNPMAGIVEGFRWSLVGGTPPPLYANISFILIILLFITGLFYFKKVEKVMADII